MEPNINAVGRRDPHPDQMSGVLLLIARRFFLPVVLTAAVSGIGVLLFDDAPMLGMWPEMVLPVLLLPLLPIGLGMLVIGLPAGYLVARLRLGLVESLALLVAIGFGLPALFMAVIFGIFAEALIFGLPGALAAAIWTLVNNDLFRRNDGT